MIVRAEALQDELEVETIQVDADAVSDDRLFAVPVATMMERRQARRESIGVRVVIVASNREQAVLENVRRKETQAQAMFADIVEAMNG